MCSPAGCRLNGPCKTIALAVKAGDRILFGKYSGNEVTLDNQEYPIMKEEDVLGVVGA